MQYRKEVDGLRAIAVIPVLFFHAGFSAFSGGYVGVDIFFVISGYLITLLILEEREAGKFSIIRFYERRARRILPALFLVMAACLVPAWLLMTPEKLENFGQSLVAVSAFANNILLSLTSEYFGPAADEKPLLHTWSLAVEEQYYVVFPAFIAVCWSFGKRRLAALIVLGAIISIGLAEWGWRRQPEENFYLTQARAWELLAGALVAFMAHGTPRTAIQNVKLGNLVSLTGLALVLYSIFAFDNRTPFPSVYTLVPAVGTALILYGANQSNIVGRVLSLPIMVGTGLISYSLYLWHQPLFAFARLASSEQPSKVVMLALIAATGVLAYLSWRYVETPFRNRKFLSRPAVFGISLAGSLAFVGLGLSAHFTNGFPQRMPQAYLAELNLFQQLAEERKEPQRTGCYLNAAIIEKAAAAYAVLRCKPQLEPARILVVGDSHAADKAMALRLNGVTVDQVIGANCSLAPSRMEPRCRRRFDTLFDNKLFANYDLVLLANRWSDANEIAAFEADLSYWTKGGAPLVLFGPMPEFDRFPDRVSYLVGTGLTREAAARSIHFNESKLLETDRALRAVAQRHSLRYIETSRIFCSIALSPCAAVSPKLTYLIVDYAHLTAPGARLFGEHVVRGLPFK